MRQKRRPLADDKAPPFFSVLIPVRDGGPAFAACLQALSESTFRRWELIVIDDGSMDASADLARRFGATVLESPNAGPAHARNMGAAVARGEFLFFIDADCAVHPEALCLAAERLMEDPDLDALFGSYDDAPAAANLISRYKNLQHHYVHQTSKEIASTFWTGCGCVKRRTFLELGGFDARRYRRPSIEDIEFGYRLKRHGGSIILAKEVQVKHLKRWTWRSWLETDIRARAVPWSKLLLEHGPISPELNLQWRQRLSGAGSMILPLLLFRQARWRLALVLVVTLLALNGGFYLFLWRKQGLGFLLACLPIHWFYYFYSTLIFAWFASSKLRSRY